LIQECVFWRYISSKSGVHGARFSVSWAILTFPWFTRFCSVIFFQGGASSFIINCFIRAAALASRPGI
jgi:hypothetical protein